MITISDIYIALFWFQVSLPPFSNFLFMIDELSSDKYIYVVLYRPRWMAVHSYDSPSSVLTL